MNPIRVASVAIFVILTIAIVVPPLPAAPADNVPGSTWTAQAKLKATISAKGVPTQNVKDLGEVTLVFGPQGGLSASQFRLLIDDGTLTLDFPGTYTLDPAGRLQLTLDLPAAAAAFLAHWNNIVDDAFGSVNLPDPDITIDKARLTAKTKSKRTGDRISIKMSSKWNLDFVLPDQTLRVKMKLKFKAKKGTRGS